MGDFETRMRQEARLIILKALAQQPNGALNSSLLGEELALFGIDRTRAWLHTQILHLADLGAAKATEAGTVLVAQLTALGRDHLARRVKLEGVKPPSDPEA